MKLNPSTICLCGGETLLRKDLIIQCCKIIKNISENKTVVNIVSNGHLITEKIAKDLKESGINFVQISLDGACNDSYDWLRRSKNGFDKALNAIKILLKHNINVGIAFVPHRNNINDLDRIIEICEEHNLSPLRIQPLMPLGRAAEELREYCLDDFEYMKLVKKIKKYRNNTKLNIEWGDPTDHCYYFTQSNGEIDYFGITAYGELVLSPYFPIIFGDLKKYSLTDYVNNGLLNAHKMIFFRRLITNVHSVKEMNVSEKFNLPLIFNDENISLDLINDKDNLYEIDKALCERYSI